MDVRVSMDENSRQTDWNEIHRRLGVLAAAPDLYFSYQEVKQMTSRLHDALSKGGVIDFVGALETCHQEMNISLSSIFGEQSPFGNTLLHAAAAAEDQDIVRVVVDHLPGEIIMIQNQVKDSPLHVAARSGRTESARAIIRRVKAYAGESNPGMSLIKNMDGSTALHVAVKDKRQEVIRMLIEEDPEMRYERNKEKKSPIYLAVEGGDVEIMKLLLEGQVVADRIRGMPPAHATVMHRRMDMMLMIAEKADFFQLKDVRGRNLLHLAAYENYKDAVSFMLDRFPESAIEYDEAGYLPAHVASKMGNVDVLQRLLETCPDPTELLNWHGQNVLHISAGYGRDSVVRGICRDPKLRKLLNQQDKDGNTPLHLAAMRGQFGAVWYLVRTKECDPKLVNHNCQTALDAAEEQVKSAVAVAVAVSHHQVITINIMRAFKVPRSKDLRLRNTVIFVPPPPNIDDTMYQVGARLVVMTLLAGIAFAMGFVVPGRLNGSNLPTSDQQGIPTMLRDRIFQTFFVFNSIAMYVSMITVSLLTWINATTDPSEAEFLLSRTTRLMVVAVFSTCAAFMAWTYLSINEIPWLRSFCLVIGFLSLCLILGVFYYKASLIQLSPRRGLFRGAADSLFFRINLMVHLTVGLLSRMYGSSDDDEEDMQSIEYAS